MAESLGSDVPLTNGWAQYQRLVLAELQRHSELHQRHQEELANLRMMVERDLSDLRARTGAVERLEHRIEKTELSINGQTAQLSALNVKSGVWGLAGGLIGFMTLALSHILKSL